jgi:outer membrane immunogenic protein
MGSSEGDFVMRKALLTGGCALALTMGAVAAQAADIPRRGAAPPPPRVASTLYNWTGAYVGINAGGGWGRSDFSAPFASPSFDVDGGMVGATLGYNWQVSQWVFGIEGDIDWTNLRGSGLCGGLACTTRNDWLGTVRGRVGYAMDRFLPYFTGGLAVGNIDTTIAGVGSGGSTKAGWTVGGGLEAALWGNLTGKIEYLYVDLGSGGGIAGSEASFRSHVARAGLNFRF